MPLLGLYNTLQNGGSISGPLSVNYTSTTAFEVNQTGGTNKVFKVDTSTPQLAYSTTGTLSTATSVGGVSVTPDFFMASNSTVRIYEASFSDTASVAPNNYFLRARGTQSSPSIVQSGDRVGLLGFAAWDGSTFRNAAAILADVDNTPGASDMPGRLRLTVTRDGASTVSDSLVLSSDPYATFTVKKVALNQTVQSGAIQPALALDSAGHSQIQAGTEANSLYWDTATTKTWLTGSVAKQRENVWLTPSYAADAASTFSLAINHDFGAPPVASTNATFTTSIGALFGDISETNNLLKNNGSQAVFLMVGLANGVGAVDYIAGAEVASAGSSTSLGNQTATLGELTGFNITPGEFTSTTNIRTVTYAYGLRSEAPTAGANVVFTNSGAAYFYGNVDMVGDVKFVAANYGIQFFGESKLGHYVESTFTPTVTLVGGAGNTVPVYSTNSGRYTRIGNRVFFTIRLSGDGGAEGAGTGVMNVALPISVSASAPASMSQRGYAITTDGDVDLLAIFTASSSTIQLYYQATATTIGAITGAKQGNTTRDIQFSGSYEV